MKLLRSKPVSVSSAQQIKGDMACKQKWRGVARQVGAVALSLCLMVCMNPFAACADTDEELAEAKAQYEEVQKKLDSLAEQYAEMAKSQSVTLDEIEKVNKQIEEKQAEIDRLVEEMNSHQGELSEYMVDSYKQDSTSFLNVLFESASFDEFVTNYEYISLIYNKKASIIETYRDLKNQMDTAKASLEENEANLESLKNEQTRQMEAMQQQRDEATELLSNLDTKVKELTEQKNAELAARAAQAASLSSGSWTTPASKVVTGEGSASAVVASCYTTPSPGLNWCAAWVTYVFSNAGIGTFSGDACDMYNEYCYSSDRSELQPGMIVAVSSNPRGGSAGTLYGHVGIYIGDGMVMENIGSITQTPIDQWISSYGSAVTPRWGWLGGVELT